MPELEGELVQSYSLVSPSFTLFSSNLAMVSSGEVIIVLN